MKKIEINGKHYIKANVVMLATQEKSKLAFDGEKLIFSDNFKHNGTTVKNQFLYFISPDEKPKENTNTFKDGLNGDWFYNSIYKFVAQIGDITPNDFKIIASTDPKLCEEKEVMGTGITSKEKRIIGFAADVHSIPDDFLAGYVNNPVGEVLLEVEDIVSTRQNGHLGQAIVHNWELKTFTDNTVLIKNIDPEPDWLNIYGQYLCETDDSRTAYEFGKWLNINFNPPQKK